MIYVECSEEVEVPTVSYQERVDMLEGHRGLRTTYESCTLELALNPGVARPTRLSHGRHVHCTGLQFNLNTVHWDPVLSFSRSLLVLPVVHEYKLATGIPEFPAMGQPLLAYVAAAIAILIPSVSQTVPCKTILHVSHDEHPYHPCSSSLEPSLRRRCVVGKDDTTSG